MPQGKYRLADTQAAPASSGSGRFSLSDVEPPLTRERQPAGAPSALSAGHHPGTVGRAGFLFDGEHTASDAAFLKRGPEVGGAAGMLLGGPVGAGIGAAAGSLAKGQYERGAHSPTSDDASDAALEGGKQLLLGGVLRGPARAAGTLGPIVAKHAKPISKTIATLTGGGTLLASGNPLMALGAGGVMKAATSPRGIKAIANVAGRVGAAIPEHVARKVGYGALSAEAFRKALLDALGADPASTVP
jgi:hypothetical protein